MQRFKTLIICNSIIQAVVKGPYPPRSYLSLPAALESSLHADHSLPENTLLQGSKHPGGSTQKSVLPSNIHQLNFHPIRDGSPLMSVPASLVLLGLTIQRCGFLEGSQWDWVPFAHTAVASFTSLSWGLLLLRVSHLFFLALSSKWTDTQPQALLWREPCFEGTFLSTKTALMSHLSPPLL